MFEWFGRIGYARHTRVAAFARHLLEGRLMGSRCTACGRRSFPPRADCPACLSSEFELEERAGTCRLLAWTTIHAAPTGFEAVAPYTLGLVELDDGGRLLASLGESLGGDVETGMPLRVVPRVLEEFEEIRVDYVLERREAVAPAHRVPTSAAAGEERA